MEKLSKIEGTTKTTDKLTGIYTRISHNSNDAGSSDCTCSNCTLPKGGSFKCGCCDIFTTRGCGNNCKTIKCGSCP